MHINTYAITVNISIAKYYLVKNNGEKIFTISEVQNFVSTLPFFS